MCQKYGKKRTGGSEYLDFWAALALEKFGDLCGGLEEVGHVYPESREWVILKVRQMETTQAAVRLSDGVLGYRVVI